MRARQELTHLRIQNDEARSVGISPLNERPGAGRIDAKLKVSYITSIYYIYIFIYKFLGS